MKKKGLTWTKKDKIMKQMENKTEIMQHVLKIPNISLSSTYIKWTERSDFLRVFMYVNADL